MLVITNLLDFGGIWPFLYIFLIFFDFQFFFQKYPFSAKMTSFDSNFWFFPVHFIKYYPAVLKNLENVKKHRFWAKKLEFWSKIGTFFEIWSFLKKKHHFFFQRSTLRSEIEKNNLKFFFSKPIPGGHFTIFNQNFGLELVFLWFRGHLRSYKRSKAAQTCPSDRTSQPYVQTFLTIQNIPFNILHR